MPGKPPVHFSDKDPWKTYRIALRRAERPRLLPPVHYSKHDPWREYRFALRRAAERVKTGLAPDNIAEDTGLVATARNSLGGSSSYRGVIWDFASQAWRSKIKVHGRTWYLGVYRMEVDAAAAYDAASWFVLGTKAVVNFPDTDFDHVDVPRAPPQWLVDALLGGARNGKAALSPLFKRWQERDAAR